MLGRIAQRTERATLRATAGTSRRYSTSHAWQAQHTIPMTTNNLRHDNSQRVFDSQRGSSSWPTYAPKLPCTLTTSKRPFTSSSNSQADQANQAAQDEPSQLTSTAMQDRRVVYRIAASYCGKNRKFDPSKYFHSYDSRSSQYWLAGKPTTPAALQSQRPPSGQDACFISEVKGTGHSAFAVADGVGGWAAQGIDSADFSHGLCGHMNKLSSEYEDAEKSNWSSASPQALLTLGHVLVCRDKSIRGGGSTACVGVATPDGQLAVSNLGDSGFMHLRLNKVHYLSEFQTHAFNTPYQLSQIPEWLLTQVAMFGGNSPLADTPAHANVTRHDLRHGDVLVFATDGVWDNLSSQDVLKLVSQKMVESGAWVDEGGGIQVSNKVLGLTEEQTTLKPLHSSIATSLVENAKQASQDRKRDGPFAKAIQREFPQDGYRGGKVDDICVVVAIVADTGRPTPLKARL